MSQKNSVDPPPSARPSQNGITQSLGSPLRARFFNTFEVVSPIYRDLFPFLAAHDFQIEAVISKRLYRAGEWRKAGPGIRFVEMPAGFAGLLPGRLAKLAAHASYALSAGLVSLFGRGTQVNVFLSQPPLFSAWGGVLRWIRGQPYCCIIMDLYPWVAVQAGVFKRGGVLARTLERIALRTLRKADAVVVIGRCMAERVAALGVPPDRIHLSRNWSNTAVVRPVDRKDNPLRAEHGLADQFVVMYSGNLGVSHFFDDLLKVARRLASRPGIVFLFVGEGSRLKEVRESVRLHRLPNIRLLGYQDYSLLAASLSMGDLHFVSLRDGFEGLVVPSKAYGILAAGRPILYQGNRRGEIARMILEEGVGEVVAQGDVEGLELAILRASADGDWRNQCGMRARAISEGAYGAAPALRTLLAVLRKVGRASRKKLEREP